MTDDDIKALIDRMDAARDFPANTCPASRHVQMIAENLLRQQPIDPREQQHCGESIAVVVANLWEVRTIADAVKKERDEALALLRDFYEGRVDATNAKWCDAVDTLLARREG